MILQNIIRCGYLLILHSIKTNAERQLRAQRPRLLRALRRLVVSTEVNQTLRLSAQNIPGRLSLNCLMLNPITVAG